MIRQRVATTAKYVYLSLIAVTTFFPLWWTFSNSFRDNFAIFNEFRLLPETFELSNYVWMIEKVNILSGFLNSVMLAIVSLFGLGLTTLMCSYALARYRFKGARLIYTMFMAAILVPGITMLGMMFQLFNALGLLGTRFGITFIYMTGNLPFSIFIMVNYLQSIPFSLEEAALMDGAGPVHIFRLVTIPLSRNGLVAVLILGFVRVWNDYIYALLLLPNKAFRTLTVTLAFTKSEHGVEYGLMSAAVMFAVIPIIIGYIAIQQQLMNGVTAGSVKA
jgi:raffinose/stachyose/melibiose transport system permease protein